jgi:hypothetical protein
MVAAELSTALPFQLTVTQNRMATCALPSQLSLSWTTSASLGCHAQTVSLEYVAWPSVSLPVGR